MRIKSIVCIAASLATSLVAQADTTLTAWTFDGQTVAAPYNSPAPSAGFGSSSVVGFSSPNADVFAVAGASTGAGSSAWRIRGTPGIGWSTTAPIGSQGARFAASTAGYYKIKVSFDVYATPDAEAKLQVQYTTEGTIWNNAPITSVGTLGVIASNSSTSNSLVVGSYVILTNNGTTGWNNQITADLTGVSGVDNNPNFAIRLVNAATGTNCVNTTGAIYNNTSGSWSFDNIAIRGTSIDTVTSWTFESEGTAGYVPHPVPEFGSGTATSIGFDTSYLFSDGSLGSTNKPDTLQNAAPFSSSGPAGQNVWRCRGQGPGNGWNTQSPIGSQGAQFDVSTLNYSDIVLSFDMFSTSQGEAKMCVQYTTDGWVTTNNAPTLYYGANPTFIVTNSISDPNYSPDTVASTYFYQNTGQNFYNNFVVDLTGVAGVTNNALFGFRIVNAAQNGDCVAFNGGSYNNASGNWRYDNVTVGGTFEGSVAPVLTFDPTATVDHSFTNTFPDDATWRSTITAVYANGIVLPGAAYAITAGKIIFTPSASAVLKTSGVKSIVIFATGYSNAKVTQPLAPGVATKLNIASQPAAPSASGGTLTLNPVLAVVDQFGNSTTNPYPNVTFTASVGGAGGWTLGGSLIQAVVNGIATYTNLSATVNGSSAVSGAVITFAVAGYPPITTTNSASFNISAPQPRFTRGNLAVIQIDTVANNTTFSMIEVRPSTAKQTSPLSITPISATGTNALRLSSAGSCGRLSLSDDGTLVTFVGFADESSATPDETFILDRAVGTLNYTNQVDVPVRYTSDSLGGSQGRSCTTTDNTNYVIADKGGLYVGSPTIPPHSVSPNNNVVVRTFGGIHYVETQKTGGSPIPAVYALNPNDPSIAVPNNLITDPVAVDFYLISTNGGASYDILYILDQVSGSLGVIKKYSWVPDNTQLSGYAWTNNGSITTGNGGDSLFATTNNTGGVYLYYTTGGGGTAANSIVQLCDASGYDAPINITSSNVIYTTSSSTSIKGLTFVPQQTPYATELIPPPVYVAQNFAATNAPFSVTNSSDDLIWQGTITGISVNGTVLPPAAFNTSVAGQITFDPSQSAALQTPGSKTIVFSSNDPDYSTNVVVQLVAGVAAKLAMVTQPKAPAWNGAPLGTQPAVAVQDQFGNPVFSTATIRATPAQATWRLGGTTNQPAVSGSAAYTGLTALSANAVNGATITFSSSGLTSVTSGSFNIPAPLHSKLNGSVNGGGALAFSFTNFPGLSFSVLGTNDLTAPLSGWPVIGVAVEGPAGTYGFTNSTSATNDQQFFILRQP